MINCLRRTDPVFLAFYLEMPLKNFFLGYGQTVPNYLWGRYLETVKLGLFCGFRLPLGLRLRFEVVQLGLDRRNHLAKVGIVVLCLFEGGQFTLNDLAGVDDTSRVLVHHKRHIDEGALVGFVGAGIEKNTEGNEVADLIALQFLDQIFAPNGYLKKLFVAFLGEAVDEELVEGPASGAGFMDRFLDPTFEFER